MRTFRTCFYLGLLFALVSVQMAQEAGFAPFTCSQPAAEQDALIREAGTNSYTISRVEFLGNEYTRDQVLRGRMPLLQEGESFSRQNLIKSLNNVSKLKIIHPVLVRDVVIHLDRVEKLVDMQICFRERRRKSGRSERAS